MKKPSMEDDIDEQGLPITSKTNSSGESKCDYSINSKESKSRKSKKKGRKQENEQSYEDLIIDIDPSALQLEDLDFDPSQLKFEQMIVEDSVSQVSNESCNEGVKEDIIQDPKALRRSQRKAEKKRKKQERRAQREGRGDPSAGQKNCDMCGASVNLLIRCTYDESLQWKMVCGKCWNKASGKCWSHVI